MLRWLSLKQSFISAQRKKAFSSETGFEDLQTSWLFFYGLDTFIAVNAALHRLSDSKQDDRNGDNDKA
jgi:hypothetical protein